MSVTTISITKNGAAPLDGVTPLNLSDAIIDRQTKGVIKISVASTVALGAIDLVPLFFGPALVQQGATILMARATATSSGGVYIGVAQLTRRSPEVGAQTNVEVLADLTLNAGQYLDQPRKFPAGHLLGISTGTVAGPHRIVLVLKQFQSSDAFSAS